MNKEQKISRINEKLKNITKIEFLLRKDKNFGY